MISHLHQGYMDITYFSFAPLEFREKRLKVILAFEHKKMQFTKYFVGQNKDVQKNYWDILRKNGFKKYPLAKEAKEYIATSVFVEKTDFANLEKLTQELEKEVIQFIESFRKVVC